jgi:hypothetical protein
MSAMPYSEMKQPLWFDKLTMSGCCFVADKSAHPELVEGAL